MSSYQVKTDPELLRQLEATSASDELVQAVFTLNLPKRKLPSPEQVRELSKNILDRAEKTTGIKAEKYNVFGYLGAFVVSAPSILIREMLSDSEIATAVANQQPESILIKQVPRK
jgi:hypothetical protein